MLVNLRARINRESLAESIRPALWLFFVVVALNLFAELCFLSANRISYLWPCSFVLVSWLLHVEKRIYPYLYLAAFIATFISNRIAGLDLLRAVADSSAVILHSFSIMWIIRRFQFSLENLNLIAWLKTIGCILLLLNPLMALLYSSLFSAIDPYYGWYDVSRTLLIRDLFSTVVFFTYFTCVTSTDIRWALKMPQFRELLIVASATLCFCAVTIQTLADPFLLIAIPLTLIALYFTLIQTAFVIFAVISVLDGLIASGILVPASSLFNQHAEELILTLTATTVFPLLGGVAMHETRNREKKIAGLSKRLNLATTSNGLGIWEWDMRTDSFTWDEQMYRLFALNKHDQEETPHWHQWIDINDLETLNQKLKTALLGEPVNNIDFKVTDAKGKRRTLCTSATPIRDEFGQIVKLVGIAQDVTDARYSALMFEQKTRIAKIAQKEFALLFEMAPGALLMADHLGMIKKANSAAHILFGYHDGELLSVTLSQLISEEMLRQHIRKPSDRRSSAPLQFFENSIELNAIRKDGSDFEIELQAQAFESNSETFLILSIRDLTEQKRVQQAISMAQQEAERANQAKSEFIANMSHEIRTPLNAVLGSSKLLENTPLSDMQLDYLTMIQSSGQALLGILNDILDISKIEAGRMELSPVDFELEEVLKKVAAIMSVNSGSKELDLIIHLHRNVPDSLYGDPLRLQQILVNLVSNAIKFTETGFIKLAIEAVEENDDAVELKFEVEDTGIGIPKDKQIRLFTAFSQADNSITRRYGGTGLGLLISKRLVEMMGGMILLDSEEGRGSVFSFTVQLQVQQAANIERSIEDVKNILLLEPNALSAQSIIDYFLRCHWRYHCFEQIDQCVDALNNDRFDAVLVSSNFSAKRIRTLHQQISDAGLRENLALVVLDRGQQRDVFMDMLKEGLIDNLMFQPVIGSALVDSIQQGINRLQGLKTPSQSTNDEQYLEGLNLLLVEDNAMNQAVAKGLLEQYGARIEIANDGAEAVAMLEKQPDRYDTILMDMQMPVMDGFTATQVIREELKIETPILAMTAGVMASEKNKCLEAGMQGFIAKPIQLDDMLNTILNVHSRESVNSADSVKQADQLAVFDPDRLLQYVKEDEQRYNDIVRMIANVISRGLTPLQEAHSAYQNGDVDSARKQFHSLKGSLGNIGAMQVWDVVKDIEQALLDETPEFAVEALIEEALENYSTMLEEANAWLSQQNITVDTEAKYLNEADFKRKLYELIAFLQENNMQAFDIYEELRGNIFQSLNNEEKTFLEEKIQNFDFNSALDTLKKLA